LRKGAPRRHCSQRTTHVLLKSDSFTCYRHYLEQEGLGFGMASAARYRAALVKAGFADIEITDRNDWYRERARAEHSALAGPLYDRLAAKVGKDFLDHEIEVWRAMTVVVDSGELRPGHLRAKRPGG